MVRPNSQASPISDGPMIQWPALGWPLCHRATEQWLTIVPRYDGTMASPSLGSPFHVVQSTIYFNGRGCCHSPHAHSLSSDSSGR